MGKSEECARNRGYGKPQVPRWLGPSPQDNLRAQTTHASPYQTAARNASRGPSAAGRKTSQRSTATDPTASGQNHSAGGPARTTTNERRQREWANHSARASEWANQLQSKRNPDARVGKALKNATGRHHKPRTPETQGDPTVPQQPAKERAQAAKAKPQHAGNEAQAVGEHRRSANQANPDASHTARQETEVPHTKPGQARTHTRRTAWPVARRSTQSSDEELDTSESDVQSESMPQDVGLGATEEAPHFAIPLSE